MTIQTTTPLKWLLTNGKLRIKAINWNHCTRGLQSSPQHLGVKIECSPHQYGLPPEPTTEPHSRYAPGNGSPPWHPHTQGEEHWKLDMPRQHLEVLRHPVSIYSDQKNWFTRGQILLVSQIVAQITKVNPWEFMATKPCIFSFVMPKLRTLALAHHLT